MHPLRLSLLVFLFYLLSSHCVKFEISYTIPYSPFILLVNICFVDIVSPKTSLSPSRCQADIKHLVLVSFSISVVAILFVVDMGASALRILLFFFFAVRPPTHAPSIAKTVAVFRLYSDCRNTASLDDGVPFHFFTNPIVYTFSCWESVVHILSNTI